MDALTIAALTGQFLTVCFLGYRLGRVTRQRDNANARALEYLREWHFAQTSKEK